MPTDTPAQYYQNQIPLREQKIALVSLPFFSGFSSCYPLALIKKLTQSGGYQCDTNHEFIEFILEFVQSDQHFEFYKRLTHESYVADICLLPLLRGWKPEMESERRRLLKAYAVPLDLANDCLEVFQQLLEAWVAKLSSYDIIGISATHYQLMPSIILIQNLKARLANDNKIVLGGYFASKKVARYLLDKHPEIDALVFGEAEGVWLELIQSLLGGNNQRFVQGSSKGFGHHPLPDQHDVLDRIKGTWLKKHFQISLEISRGCYWDKCDFCNFNGSYETHFQRNNYQQIIDVMDQLRDSYGQRRFQFIDTALPPGFASFLVNNNISRDYDIFVEIRPDFSYKQLKALQRLGKLTVQIGIESLVDAHLEMMNKNATVATNIRSLLACKKLGIKVIWGVFVGHPKETHQHLCALLENVQKWQHLPPPKYVTHCQVRPGSPLWDERQALGIIYYPLSDVFELLINPIAEALEFYPYYESSSQQNGLCRELITQIEDAVTEWQTSPQYHCCYSCTNSLSLAIAKMLDDSILTFDELCNACKELDFPTEYVEKQLTEMIDHGIVYAGYQRKPRAQIYTLLKPEYLLFEEKHV